MPYKDQGYITISRETKELLNKYRGKKTWGDFLLELQEESLKADKEGTDNEK